MELRIIPVEEMKGRESILLSKLAVYGKDPNLDASMRLELRDRITIEDNRKLKRIDAIGKRGDFTYIIEAKRKLNYEAIGQVFIYECLYAKQHPGEKEKIKKGIVCQDTTDEVLLSFCKENDITVFELTTNGIKEHKPKFHQCPTT